MHTYLGEGENDAVNLTSENAGCAASLQTEIKYFQSIDSPSEPVNCIPFREHEHDLHLNSVGLRITSTAVLLATEYSCWANWVKGTDEI